MTYLARLVEQSGLSVAGRTPPSIVPAVPDRQPGDEALREVNVEKVAPPPVQGAAPAERQPPTPEVLEHVETRAEPMAQKQPAPDTPRLPNHATVPGANMSPPPSPPGSPPSPTALPGGEHRVESVSVEVTRNETLRRVIEWVSDNAVQSTAQIAEPTDVIVTREAAPGPPAPPAPRPPVVEIADPAPPPPRPEPRPERRDVPPERVQIIDARQPEPPPRKEAPAPREERVEISIGAINLTLEAPPKPTPAPSPAIAAPPAPPPPAAARPAPPSSNRLRRRFIRV